MLTMAYIFLFYSYQTKTLINFIIISVFGMTYNLFFIFVLLHEYVQLNRASSSSSLSSNDSGTPIDVEIPLDESNGLGYYNSNFQVLDELFI